MAVEAISKRLRFEIFKRDRFTCAYCGRSTPAVVLHVDHIDPRARGGTNDPANLITSCSDCNLGKSDRPLGDVMPHVRAEAVDEMRERVEQMRAYREWRAEFDHELRLELDRVWQAWIEEFGGYYDKENNQYRCQVGFPTDNAVLEYLAVLPTSEIVDSVRGAARRYHSRNGEPLYASAVARYFYAICKNKARLADEERRNVTITWEELAQLVPDLAALHDELETFNPIDPWRFCGTRIWSGGWHVRYDDHTRDVAPPPERIAQLVGPKSINARDPLLGTQTAHDVAVRTIRAVVPPCGQSCECGRTKRVPREEDYPRCGRCGQVSEPVDRRESCDPVAVEWDGQIYHPLEYGFEASLRQCKIAENYGRYRRLKARDEPTAPARCTGCNAPLLGYHHEGCKQAPCTVCGEQLDYRHAKDHRAPYMDRSIAQVLASMRKMGQRPGGAA